jgi:Fic family protein
MNNFDRRIRNLPPSVWMTIARIDEIKGRWSQGANLHPYQLAHVRKTVLVTSTGASTRIEGATLTDADVEKLLRRAEPKAAEGKDEQEVRGYSGLLERVFDLHASIPFSESTILSFHNEMMRFVEAAEPFRGRYKSVENAVTAVGPKGSAVVMRTTPPYLVRKEMETLLEWTGDRLASGDVHPLAVVANFVVEFLKIHPFQDGNGRLSRILTSLLLLKSGYAFAPYVSHERIIERRRKDYYLALRRSQAGIGTDAEDVLPWVEFFLAVTLEQSEKAVALMEGADVGDVLSERQLSVYNAVVSGNGASAGEVAVSTGVGRPTVNQALAKLVTMKKITKTGIGRGTRYWPTRKQP